MNVDKISKRTGVEQASSLKMAKLIEESDTHHFLYKIHDNIVMVEVTNSNIVFYIDTGADTPVTCVDNAHTRDDWHFSEGDERKEYVKQSFLTL